MGHVYNKPLQASYFPTKEAICLTAEGYLQTGPNGDTTKIMTDQNGESLCVHRSNAFCAESIENLDLLTEADYDTLRNILGDTPVTTPGADSGVFVLVIKMPWFVLRIRRTSVLLIT